ncbi:MAG: phosphodiester glycosidase family protein, partial [Cyanobacteria bacterium]|nr:phosphodiester glycosidase family protein [Cyanobacteriota bacterium]MDW8203093.1 phosphodiester glycosidase family protein [Cyanobacteriota bacterium SKYGB_h_bin112]
VLTMARRWQAIAAINGGFFSRNTYSPLGAIRRDGVWYSSPILNRGAIAWGNDGTVMINRLSLSQAITTNTGQSFPLLHTDSGYVQAGLSRYTLAWGNTYSPLTDNEVVITVSRNQVVGQQTLGKAGDNAIPLPADGYLLVARSYRTAANALPPGTIIQLTGTTMPPEFQNYPHIVGGGPLLLQGGQIVLDAAREQFSNAFITEAAVRSAIATLPNGNLAIVTVQHRVNGRGPTLAELAQIMQQLGTVDALNLDGGSSTTLYLGGQILNRSPRTTARVHNSIGIFLSF